jgi:SpoVK/Ycf46/Vps4 family AAA+-type ATPase
MSDAVSSPWDDLALPRDELDQVTYLIARIRSRRGGIGVSALLSGPPGTGTTVVAALIANELGLGLHRIDCAAPIATAWSDTERELAAWLATTDPSRAILLFDNVSATFTRSLLERLSAFTGILLLSTSDASLFDPAILRRLSLHVRFASHRTL